MDYETRIELKHEDLLMDFEEEHGRAPTPAEYQKLYDEAKQYVEEEMAARADYLRKIAKGE